MEYCFSSLHQTLTTLIHRIDSFFQLIDTQLPSNTLTGQSIPHHLHPLSSKMPAIVSPTLRRVQGFQDLRAVVLDVSDFRTSLVPSHARDISSASREIPTISTTSSHSSGYIAWNGDNSLHHLLRNLPETPLIANIYPADSDTTSHASLRKVGHRPWRFLRDIYHKPLHHFQHPTKTSHPRASFPSTLQPDTLPWIYWHEIQLTQIHHASRELSLWRFLQWLYSAFNVQCRVNGSASRMAFPRWKRGKRELANYVVDMLECRRLWIEHDRYGEIAESVSIVLQGWLWEE